MSMYWDVIVNVLKNRPHAVGAEIGIFKGFFAKEILTKLPGIKQYYCVDPWQHYDEYTEILRPQSNEILVKPEKAFQIFCNKIKPFADKVIIIREMSQDGLLHVPDKSLDFVFIDANHTYEYAKPDIVGWSKKVKQGGIIAGHDFSDLQYRGKRKVPFGVERAVRELIPKFRVEGNTWYSEKE